MSSNSDEWKSRCNQQVDRYEIQEREFEKFSNSIYIDLTKQLLFLNSALFAASIGFISRLSAETVPKWMLIVIWSLLCISILSGLLQLLVEHFYYSRVVDWFYKWASLHSKCESEDVHIFAASIQNADESGFKLKSNQLAFYVQISSFVAVIVFVLCFLISYII